MTKTKRIPILDVKVGMKIKTATQDGIVFKTITDAFSTDVQPDNQVRIEFENSTIIHCSDNHPIMVMRDGLIEQVNPTMLSRDDQVITPDGYTRMLTCDVGQNNPTNYIDITVEDTHTFFTSKHEQDEQVLTHNSQGGIRNASCTVYLPIFHIQFEDFCHLKNSQGTEETRIRFQDYSVVLSAFFWRRLKNKGVITLFDPNEVPDLFSSFYNSIERFEELYLYYEKQDNIRKIEVSAETMFKEWILKERTDTGRIYLMFVDNVIRQTPFDVTSDPIVQSNLCSEILLPSKPFERLDDQNGRIALCTLGSINYGLYRRPEDMRAACRILVRSLSNVLSYQDFLSIQSKLANDEFEPLGIGITNLAYWHAKRGLKYGTPEALAELKRWIEHQAYYLTEASVELAEERGSCTKSHTTCYGKGIFPWEKRAVGVNELTDFTPELDWEPLRIRMLKSGIKNATLMAIAPVESSSVVIDSTNGIELPMAFISTKESKAGAFTQVIPEYLKYKSKYQLMWDQKDCIDYLKVSAVLSAYCDQSISTNTFYSPKYFENGKIPATLIAKNLMLAHKWGIKTFYYSLMEKLGSKDQSNYIVDLPSEQVAADDGDDHCDSCVL